MTAVPGRVTSFPRIPGHEVAGEVVEIGSEVAHVGVGDRVTCHFYLTCGVCRFCRSGRETLCPASPGNVGMASDGAYAEYMAIPARNVTPIPQGVSDVDAAIAADAIATPYHACREEARVGPGDSVLIVGAGGGVGIHAVQMAKLCGGWVLAADITDEKLAAAGDCGADALVDGRRDDLAAQVAGPRRAPRDHRQPPHRRLRRGLELHGRSPARARLHARDPRLALRHSDPDRADPGAPAATAHPRDREPDLPARRGGRSPRVATQERAGRPGRARAGILTRPALVTSAGAEALRCACRAPAPPDRRR